MFKISLLVFLGECFNDKIFPISFYTEDKADVDASKGKIISPADEGVQLLSMNIPKLRHVHGKFSLPKNEFASVNDIKILIELIKLTDENEMVIYDTKEIILEKHSSEVDYDFEVNSGKYILNHVVENSKNYSCNRYYFSTDGYTTDIKKAHILNVNNDDIKNINMTLVKK